MPGVNGGFLHKIYNTGAKNTFKLLPVVVHLRMVENVRSERMGSKRLVMLILALAMVWTLAACGSQNDGTVIGVCVDDAQDPWTAEFLAALEPCLAELGYEIKLSECGADQSVQNAQVDELIGDQVDGLILIPCMSAGAEVLMEKLSKANIPGVLCHREVSADVLERFSGAAFVGVDRANVGACQADIILSTDTRGDANGDGRISYILLQLPADHLDTGLRTEGVLDGLDWAGAEPAELAAQCANGDQTTAQGVCESLLRQFGPDVEAIISNDDAMALGAAEVILSAGGTVGQGLYIVGADGSREALEAVRAGKLTGTVVEDVAGQAQLAAQVLQKLIGGVAVGQVYYVPHIPVTAKNVDEFLTEGE